MIILKFLRFFNGFIRVRALGQHPERIINICYKNGITIWGIKKKNQDLFFNVFPKDFKLLKQIRNKSGVSIKIKYKIGLPFVIKRHKNRLGLVIGFVIFIIGLNIFSSFVWNINVTGNVNVNKDEIMYYANEVGIYNGMPKSKINSPEMRNTMLYKFNKLSWVSFNLEGSVLTINVSETKPGQPKEDKRPTNIVASKDGVIEYLEITSGYAAVKVGQAVKKGELLVSGATEFKEGVSYFYNSNAKVLAQTEVVFKKSLPQTQTITTKSGKVVTKKAFEFFGLNIPLYLGSVKGEYIKEINGDYIKFNENYLPIKLVTANFYELKTNTVNYSVDDVKAQLKSEADIGLKTDKIFKIIDVKDEFTVTNGVVTIVRKATVLEEIGTEKIINIGAQS